MMMTPWHLWRHTWCQREASSWQILCHYGVDMFIGELPEDGFCISNRLWDIQKTKCSGSHRPSASAAGLNKFVWPWFSRSTIKAEILDIGNDSFDTKIKSTSCLQPEISKVKRNFFMTLSKKGKSSRNVIFSNIFDIPGLKNVRILVSNTTFTRAPVCSLMFRWDCRLIVGAKIDAIILSVWCLQPVIRKVIRKCVWPSFSGLTIKVR